VEIATPATNGKGKAAGKEVKQRFLFDGINSHRRHLRIIHIIQYAIFVLIYPADTAFALPYLAAPLADITAHSGFREAIIKHRLVHN
jgi:hypothetical protein